VETAGDCYIVSGGIMATHPTNGFLCTLEEVSTCVAGWLPTKLPTIRASNLHTADLPIMPHAPCPFDGKPYAVLQLGTAGRLASRTPNPLQ